MRPQLTELVMLRALAQDRAEKFRVYQRRYFSIKAIDSVLPTSLTYNSPRARLGLFNHEENESRPDVMYDEGAAVEKNWLSQALREVRVEFLMTTTIQRGSLQRCDHVSKHLYLAGVCPQIL